MLSPIIFHPNGFGENIYEYLRKPRPVYRLDGPLSFTSLNAFFVEHLADVPRANPTSLLRSKTLAVLCLSSAWILDFLTYCVPIRSQSSLRHRLSRPRAFRIRDLSTALLHPAVQIF